MLLALAAISRKASHAREPCGGRLELVQRLRGGFLPVAFASGPCCSASLASMCPPAVRRGVTTMFEARHRHKMQQQ
eukprot:3568567-Prymnesium_polylepis.1